MISRHQKRQALAAGIGLITLALLDLEILLLMSGDHPLVMYIFSQSQWSLSGDAKEQAFILILNLLFVVPYMSYFWVRRIPTNDDIGKAILRVSIFACLVGLFLAFSRIGILSRTAFLVTTTQTLLAIVAVDLLISKVKPFVLIDCVEPPLGTVLVRGVRIESPQAWVAEDLETVRTQIDGILVAESPGGIPALIRDLVSSSINIYNREQIQEQISGRVELGDKLIAELHTNLEHAGYLAIRRVLDILVSLIVLPPGALVLLVFGVLIRMEGRGTFLFAQERVGRGGRSFKLYKLRTMIPENQSHATFASENIHRITKFGRVARRCRVDEIPQFWNILVGEMTLIGPRPEQTMFVAEYEAAIPFYGIRHRVRPGLTGWAQVKQGYAEGLDETQVKLAYDIYYIKHVSVWLDGLIAIKTLHFIISGE